MPPLSLTLIYKWSSSTKHILRLYKIFPLRSKAFRLRKHYFKQQVLLKHLRIKALYKIKGWFTWLQCILGLDSQTSKLWPGDVRCRIPNDMERTNICYWKPTVLNMSISDKRRNTQLSMKSAVSSLTGIIKNVSFWVFELSQPLRMPEVKLADLSSIPGTNSVGRGN